MTRTRVINAPVLSGTVYNSRFGSLDTFTYNGGGYAKCVDTVAPGNGHPLQITKVPTRSGGIINGRMTLYPFYEDFSNYCVFAVRGYSTFTGYTFPSGHPGFGSIPSDAVLATRLLAETNPSRADVDIPVFVAELKDLPELVRKAGGTLIKQIAKYNLRYQFGIRPLISDLTAMLDFVSLTEKRFQELKALSKGGLRRKRRLFEAAGAYTTAPFVVDSTNQLFMKGIEMSAKQLSIWGFVKWVPTPSLPKTDAALLALARRAVLGLTIDGATAWELIPFSWLIDWYSTVGAYLTATRNIVPCKPKLPIQLMKHYAGNTQITFKPYNGVSATTFNCTYEQKNRISANPSPIAARLPVLSLRQFSILASLAVTRSHGYKL